MRRLLLSLLAGAALFLDGCVVGPNYKRPPANSPPLYRGQPAEEQSSFADLPWWEVFRDETLRGLIQSAIANNHDLRVAVARVEQARQFTVQARAEYLPGVGYTVGASVGRNESLGSLAPSGGMRRGAVAVALGATWEADVWGRIRRSNEVALARYLQTEEARRGVILSLMSNVARAYFELLDLDLRLDIARRNVQAFEGTLNLFQERLDAGKASRLETARARAAVATTSSTIPELERQIAVQENEIQILLGSLPGPIVRHGTLLEQTIPPDVPAGLPSTLLERRPDILASESAVKAANAQIGIATAAFFPKIGLTALLGEASSPLDELTTGRATVWSLAGTALGPIYTGRSLRARQREAIAFWEETRIQYEQTALGAFRDVSNALVTRQKLEAERNRLADAVTAYQEAVDVAQQRYSAGKSSYFEVLDAQQQLFPAQVALALIERDRRVVLVQLYQALGGGWKLKDAEWTGPKP
ncbi:MAG: efflux transporter outer membrane subunit [Bryobacteraceae bacterium]